MKVRSCFVSNSSSSSFIVINREGHTWIPDNMVTPGEPFVVDGSLGVTEFGWGPATIRGTGSKIIFSYIQAKSIENAQWLEMLEKVIKEYTHCSSIEWNISEDYNDENWAYIDHQSASTEGMNTEMFDNEESLKCFLFSDRSHIKLDNDNH